MTPHAASVELVYRHARPEFVRSDWTWVDKDMDRTRTHPSWWCDHPAEEKKPSTSGFGMMAGCSGRSIIKRLATTLIRLS